MGDYVPAFKQNITVCVRAAQAVLDIAADEAADDEELLEAVIDIGLNMHKLRRTRPEMLAGCTPYFEASATLLAMEKAGSLRTKRSLSAVKSGLGTVASMIVGFGTRALTFGKVAATTSYMHASAMPRWAKVAAVSMSAASFFGTAFQIHALVNRQEAEDTRVGPMPEPAPTEKPAWPTPKEGECLIDMRTGQYVQDGSCHVPGGQRRRRSTKAECHEGRCLIRPRVVRRSAGEPAWITKLRGESIYPSVTLPANRTLWNMPTLPVAALEQPDFLADPAIEAAKGWDDVPTEIQLAAWRACKHLLHTGHPDRHYGLVSDSDLVNQFSSCQEGVRDTHMRTGQAPRRARRSVDIPQQELDKVVRAAGCMMVMTTDSAKPAERPRLFIDCSDRSDRMASLRLGCRLVNTMDYHLDGLLRKMGANKRLTFTECSECAKWNTCKQQEVFREKCGKPGGPGGFFTRRSREEKMLRLDLEVLAAGFGCGPKTRSRRAVGRSPSQSFREAAFEKDTNLIEETLAPNGHFAQFMDSLDNVDSKCENANAPMTALKAILFSRVVAKKEIEQSTASNGTFHLFLKDEVNKALMGESPTAETMRSWATDEKGIWAVQATAKILEMTMPILELAREVFSHYKPGELPRERQRPTGHPTFDAAQAMAALIKGPRARYDLRCEERQLIALMFVMASEAGIDGRDECWPSGSPHKAGGGCRGQGLTSPQRPFCYEREDTAVRTGFRRFMDKECVDHETGEITTFVEYLSANLRGRLVNRWKWAYGWAKGGRARRSAAAIHASRGMRDYCRVVTAHLVLELLGFSTPCILWDLVVTLSNSDPRLKVTEDTALNVWPAYVKIPYTALFKIVLFAVPVEVKVPTKRGMSAALAPGDYDCDGLTKKRCRAKRLKRCGWLYMAEMNQYSVSNFEELAPAVCPMVVRTWLWERLTEPRASAPAWRRPCLNEAGPGWGDSIDEQRAIFNSTILTETHNTREDGRPPVLMDKAGSIDCADRSSDTDKQCLRFAGTIDLAARLTKACRSRITTDWRGAVKAANPRFDEFFTLSEKERRRQEIARKTKVPVHKEVGAKKVKDPRDSRNKAIQSGAMSDGSTESHRPLNNRRVRRSAPGLPSACLDDEGINYVGNDAMAGDRRVCFTPTKTAWCNSEKKARNGPEDCRRFCKVKGEGLFSYNRARRWCVCKFSSSGQTYDKGWLSGETHCTAHKRNSGSSILSQLHACVDERDVDYYGNDDGSWETPKSVKCFKRTDSYCTTTRKRDSSVEDCRRFCRGSNFFTFNRAKGSCWCKHSDKGAIRNNVTRGLISGKVDCSRPDLCVFGTEDSCKETGPTDEHPKGRFAPWDKWDEEKQECFLGHPVVFERPEPAVCDISQATMIRRWTLRMIRAGNTVVAGRPIHRTQRISVGRHFGDQTEGDHAMRCENIEAVLPGRFITVPGQRCWFHGNDDCDPKTVEYVQVAKVGPAIGREDEFTDSLARRGADCRVYEYTFWPSPDEVYFKAMRANRCKGNLTGAECWERVINGKVDDEVAWLWAAARDEPVMPYVLQNLAYKVEESMASHRWANPEAVFEARADWLRRANCFPADCGPDRTWWGLEKEEVTTTTTTEETWADAGSCTMFGCAAEAAQPNMFGDATTEQDQTTSGQSAGISQETIDALLDWGASLDPIPGPEGAAPRRAKRSGEGAYVAIPRALLEDHPQTYHVKVGVTAANERYLNLPFELPADPIHEGLEFLNDGLLHNVRAKFRGRDVPNPFRWSADKDGLTKEQALLLGRRDQLMKETRRWIRFGITARGNYKDHTNKETINAMIRREEERWRNRRTRREVPEPLSLPWRAICEYCHTKHPNEDERFRDLIRPRRQVTMAVGMFGMITVAHYLMGILSGDQVSALHKRLGQLRKVAAATFGNLGTMGGTVQNLARMNARIFEGLRREQSTWEWDHMWNSHFKEVTEAITTHMEVMASAASQTVHPSLLTQADLGKWAEELTRIKEETGYTPILPSPLQWLSLPSTFSAIGGPYSPKNGMEERFVYKGARVVIRLPLSHKDTRMEMLQRIDMPISTGEGEHGRISPVEVRTLVVQQDKPDADKEWTTLTASELARCRRMAQSYTCPSIGALRRPVKDSNEIIEENDDLCAYAIWRGHANLQNRACRVTSGSEDVIARKVDGHRFVVFTKKRMELNIKCDNKLYTKEISSLRVERLATVHLPPGCTARSESLTLYSDGDLAEGPVTPLVTNRVNKQLLGMLQGAVRIRRMVEDRTNELRADAEASNATLQASMTNHRALNRNIAQFRKDAEQDIRHESIWRWVLSHLILTAVITTIGGVALWSSSKCLRRTVTAKANQAKITMTAGIQAIETGKTHNDERIPGTREIAERTRMNEDRIRYVRAAVFAVLSVNGDSTAWLDAYELMANFTGSLDHDPTPEEKRAESLRCQNIIDTIRRINEASMTEHAMSAVRPGPHLMLENRSVQPEEATITVSTTSSGAVPRTAPAAQRTNHNKGRAPLPPPGGPNRR